MAICVKFRSRHSIPSSGYITGEHCHCNRISSADWFPFSKHSNIDRLWAIWQTLNPDKWFEEDGQRLFDQQTIGLGNTVTTNTPLRPFHKDEQGTIWMPDEVCDWLKLGYSYPELRPWLSKYRSGSSFNRDSYVTDIFESVNVTYGTSRREALHMLDEATSGTDLPDGMTLVGDGVASNDFAISVRYSKYATTSIHISCFSHWLNPAGLPSEVTPSTSRSSLKEREVRARTIVQTITSRMFIILASRRE